MAVQDGRAALVIKSIVREVVAGCAEAGAFVNDALATFMVRAVVLDPSNRHSSQDHMTKDGVASIVEECVQRVLVKNSLTQATIRMQLAFESDFVSIDDAAREIFRSRDETAGDIERDIIESNAVRQSDLEATYRKMVLAALLRTDMGAPDNRNVIRECTAALESVLPPMELGVFLSLSATEKAEQLGDLAMIVGGIRLFNKYRGKGGGEIRDFASELSALGVELLTTTYSEVVRLSDLAVQTSVVQCHSDAGNIGDVNSYVDATVNSRQHRTYVALLHHLACTVAIQAEDVSARFFKRESLLAQTVASKTAVPTEQVYPQFMEFYQLYEKLRVLVVTLERAKALHTQLQSLAAAHASFVTEHAQALHEGAQGSDNSGAAHDLHRRHIEFATSTYLQTMRSATQFQKIADVELPSLTSPAAGADGDSEQDNTALSLPHDTAGDFGTAQVLLPDVAHGYSSIALHVGGFCPVLAAQDPPLLVPANRRLGIVKYDGRFYGFANANTGKQFLEHMDTTIEALKTNAKARAELIELLQLHEYFESIAIDSNTGVQRDGARKGLLPLKCDGGTQTDTHFVESNIVPGYESNEWELRRKAIKLANLRQKKTTSSQTASSGFRRDTSAQTYAPKTSTTQTRRDAGTNVSKPSTYIRGLRGPRGRHAEPAEVVDLTLGIGGVAVGIQGTTKPKSSGTRAKK
eukprot:m.1481072 g.1481072  ORF g.1481072 m.1481072 type:complete len:693 (+) comp25173_c2_seq4:240-2318(+)